MKREHGAYIDARYSTDNQSADSIEVQVDKCAEWCAAQGLPVLGVYADYAVSGMKDTRPQYEAMMRDLRNGGADTVVIYDQSRMFRDISSWFRFRAELEQMGVRVVSITQPLIGGDLRDPANFMNEGVSALFSHMWALQTRQKVMEKMRYMAKNGQHTGGKPALGYRIEDGCLAIDEAEAAIVRRIFREYASGQSYKDIIAGLNRDGLKTKRGNPFGSNSLHDLLKNEKYTGVLIYGGKPYRPDGSRNSHAAPADDAIRIEDAVPAIVTRELFDKVQARLAQNKRDQSGRPPAKRDYPLKGKIFCGHCKSAMNVSTSKGNYDYYKCSRKKQQKTGCENTPIRVDKLEDNVAAMVRAQLSSGMVTDSLLRVLRDGAAQLQSGAVERLDRLTAQERDIARKLENAMDAILDGLTSPALKKRVADLESQQRAINRDIKALRQQMEAAALPESRIRELIEKCTTSQNPADILFLVSRVEVYRDHIEVWCIWDPDPTKSIDYTTPGIPAAETVTNINGTPFGVPLIFVTSQFLRIVVAR